MEREKLEDNDPCLNHVKKYLLGEKLKDSDKYEYYFLYVKSVEPIYRSIKVGMKVKYDYVFKVRS